MNNLVVRALAGAVFVGIIIGSVLWSHYAATAVFAVFAILGIVEFFNLFKNHDTIEINVGMGTGVVVVSYLIMVAALYGYIDLTSMIIPLLFVLMLTELWRQKKNPIFNAAIYVLGALYVALPFYWITSINFKDTMPFYYGYDVSSIGEVYDPTADFFPVILVLFILVWTNDTFAYLTGKFFGRKKLFERISPNKTWEGTLGGIMFTVIAGTLFHLFVNTETYPYFWILTPLIVAPAAILGDLFQSMMKRSLNIKDSGNIIPGHGGILDRFDAMIFTIPFYIAWVSLYPSLYKLFTA